MSTILATAGSNSSTSINFELVKYTAGLISERPVDLLELATLDIPMYSADLEKATGIPGVITDLKGRIQGASGIVLSANEHNGNPSAFFKNALDWLSREDRNFLSDLPMLLMSASGGRRGGTSSRAVLEQMLPRFGARIVGTFSLPSYYENFDPESGITEPELAGMHRRAVEEFIASL
jgi:NAD(P)H-dependent FMN reductase